MRNKKVKGHKALEKLKNLVHYQLMTGEESKILKEIKS